MTVEWFVSKLPHLRNALEVGFETFLAEQRFPFKLGYIKKPYLGHTMVASKSNELREYFSHTNALPLLPPGDNLLELRLVCGFRIPSCDVLPRAIFKVHLWVPSLI